MLATIEPLKVMKYGITVSCIIAALYLTITCIYEYTLDKNASSINFKDFHADENSLYLSVSLCFYGDDIFINGIDKEKYINFLSGCENNDACNWNASFADVDYDNVTKDFSGYILEEIKLFKDNTGEIYVYKKITDRGAHVTGSRHKTFYVYDGEGRVYTSRRRSDQKCITLDMPFKKGKKIRFHSILLNNSVFAD